MPYIPKFDRYDLDCSGDCDRREPNTCGELNFVITDFIHKYIESKTLRYPTINEVIGVLECCKLELYSQVARPYEDKKKKENGPVSEFDK